MSLIIEKIGPGNYKVSNPIKKGAVPDYKEMHKVLVLQLGVSQENVLSLSDSNAELKRNLRNALYDKGHHEEVFSSLNSHWTKSLLPQAVKRYIGKIASQAKS